MKSLIRSLALYWDRRLLSIFCLGIASGFPAVIIGSAASAWLKDEGISRTSIGFFGAVFAVYSINFLWAPLVDRIKLPLLGNLLGQRRSWILLTQIGVVSGCFVMSQFDDINQLSQLGLVALILATFSATQDIAIDAFRVDTIQAEESDKLAAAAAMATCGWWTGFAAFGAIPFYLADRPGWEWPAIFFVMACIMAVLMLVPLLATEPASDREAAQSHSFSLYQQKLTAHPRLHREILMSVIVLAGLTLTWIWHLASPDSAPRVLFDDYFVFIALLGGGIQLYLLVNIVELYNLPAMEQSHTSNKHRVLCWIMVTLVDPIGDFFKRNGVTFALTILLFIFLFKIGEAYLGRMSVVFYKEVGFSNEDIAIYSKLVNWWVTIVFSLVGSLVTVRYGIFKGLMIGGIAMSASNLMFSWIAVAGPIPELLVAAVVVDGFTGAWSSVAFVAFISLMCNRTFSASQYALMASLGTFGRTLIGSFSGAVVDYMEGNWALFFILTSTMVTPSLIMLWFLRGKIAELETANGHN